MDTIKNEKVELTLYHGEGSSKDFVAAIGKHVTLPEGAVKIANVQSGTINEGQENEISWASLICYEVERYQKYASINESAKTPTLKLKLKNYAGQDLTSYVNCQVDISNCEIVLATNRYGQPIGFDLSVDFKKLKIIKPQTMK
ncbi:MAG: hypothetical protein SPF57_06995 [Streptococcus orisratti]|uniref:hypothetical protein n=1 Tax=Streptococcus orisratti TaxID=114652 RepID=UPI002A912135|nr:hypothetical protein [Streptococcus orisratti]MDY5636070.1 hypothetical protein [Streptococcus orisratti]